MGRNARENWRLAIFGLALLAVVVFYHDCRRFVDKYWARGASPPVAGQMVLPEEMYDTLAPGYENGLEETDRFIALASWYGQQYHGRLMANGEPYNMYGYTCAHRTLPLGTLVLFEYQGEEILLEVTDRGPFIKGRTWDLSYAGALALGMIKVGVAPVLATIYQPVKK